MAWILPFVLLGSCDKKLVEYEKGSVEIVVERGDAWLHDFPLFLGIKRKNPPQIAVWIEDAQGRYLSTVYASSKIATQSWLAAGGSPKSAARIVQQVAQHGAQIDLNLLHAPQQRARGAGLLRMAQVGLGHEIAAGEIGGELLRGFEPGGAARMEAPQHPGRAQRQHQQPRAPGRRAGPAQQIGQQHQ